MFRDSFGTHRYILQLLNDFPCRGNLSLLDKLEHAGGKGRPKNYIQVVFSFVDFLQGVSILRNVWFKEKVLSRYLGFVGWLGIWFLFGLL